MTIVATITAFINAIFAPFRFVKKNVTANIMIAINIVKNFWSNAMILICNATVSQGLIDRVLSMEAIASSYLSILARAEPL